MSSSISSFQIFHGCEDDDSDLNIGLETFTKNIEKIIKIIGSFLCLLTRYNERRAYNMLALMLDPRLKV